MYTRKNKNPSGWSKLLYKLSLLVSRVRSQASADIAIAKAQRSVDRKIKAARDSRGAGTQRQNAGDPRSQKSVAQKSMMREN
jgi:hypothetical protein